MEENLRYYEKGRTVPATAQREIEAGRLKGKTDINPMWRIKMLTEMFGPVGIGWYIEKGNSWLEEGANGEIAAFMEITLYVKENGEWSKPIFGTGGSMFVAKERNGLYTDDEAYKKAYTDAISVACKALGIGADVYWEKDSTKYDDTSKTPSTTPQEASAGQRKNSGSATPQRAKAGGITLSMLRDFGVENITGIAQYLGKKFGKPIDQLDEEETRIAWEYLSRKKAEKESIEAYERALREDDAVPPWEDDGGEE